MTIKTEDILELFYKEFDIPKRFYTIVNLGDLDNNYQEVSEDTLEELFENYGHHMASPTDEYIEDIKDFEEYDEEYPEISIEMMYNIEDVIIKYLRSTWKHDRYGSYLIIGINLYGINDVNDEIACRAYGSTRLEALLKLCAELKDNKFVYDGVRKAIGIS